MKIDVDKIAGQVVKRLGEYEDVIQGKNINASSCGMCDNVPSYKEGDPKCTYCPYNAYWGSGCDNTRYDYPFRVNHYTHKPRPNTEDKERLIDHYKALKKSVAKWGAKYGWDFTFPEIDYDKFIKGDK